MRCSFSLAAAAFNIILLSSCSTNPETGAEQAPASAVLAFNNFDNLDGWLADSPNQVTLTRAQAHSGKYSTMIGPTQNYSLGYSNPLSRLIPDGVSRLTVGAWVLLPNEQATAKLVTELKAPTNLGTDLMWEGLSLAKSVKAYNEWQYVEQSITIPAAAKPSNRLVVYLWRADSKYPVYLDDLKISVTGGSPAAVVPASSQKPTPPGSAQ